MKFWVIAKKDTLIRLRDRRGFLILFLMPLLLTFILGSALQGVFSDDGSSMPRMTIAIYDGDGGALSKTLLTDVLQSPDLKPYITLRSASGEDEVKSEVANNEVDAGLLIPSRFSNDLLNGEATRLQVLSDPSKPVIAQILRTITTSFTSRVTEVTNASGQVLGDLGALAKKIGEQAAQTGKMPEHMPDMQALATQIPRDLQLISQSSGLNIQEQPVGKHPVTAMQYYAAGMSVMFMLFSASVGAKSILNERETETLTRLMSTPTNNRQILLGKFVGNLLFTLMQFVVLVVATHWLFGIDWGENWGQLFLVGLVFSIAVSGMAICLASLVRDAQSADIASSIGIQILAVLGGSMIPLDAFPDAMRIIARFIPNSWALTGLLDSMSGTDWGALLLPSGVLLAIGVVTLGIGTWRLRAR